MTQEDKELLLKDLCARLPYGVMCNIGLAYPLPIQRIFVDRLDGVLLDFYEDGNDYQVYLSEAKPYLRPMSSMTEEEENEWNGLNIDPLLEAVNGQHTRNEDLMLRTKSQYNPFDYLNANHFDYRGLIPMGLAIEVTEENNPYK